MMLVHIVYFSILMKICLMLAKTVSRRVLDKTLWFPQLLQQGRFISGRCNHVYS